MATELKDADNVYYEICNEPYFHGPTMEWQKRMAQVVADTEKQLGVRHLISLNIANHEAEVKDPDPNVSIFNFHYARPPRTVKMNYALNKPIGLNETGFDGALDGPYRIQAWDFLLAGGALYNNLDYSFTVGHEDGTFLVPARQPGGGSPALRSQLKTLVEFFGMIDFARMTPDENLVTGGVPEAASARALAVPGRTYALYLHHGRVLADHQPRYVIQTRRQKARLVTSIPAGSYKVRWIDPKSGKEVASAAFLGGTLETPEYSQDIAAMITAAP
jgi:hypothetical protein